MVTSMKIAMYNVLKNNGKYFEELEFKQCSHTKALLARLLMITESGITFFWIVIVVFLWVKFGTTSIVEVSMSKNLRKNLLHNRYER